MRIEVLDVQGRKSGFRVSKSTAVRWVGNGTYDWVDDRHRSIRERAQVIGAGGVQYVSGAGVAYVPVPEPVQMIISQADPNRFLKLDYHQSVVKMPLGDIAPGKCLVLDYPLPDQSSYAKQHKRDIWGGERIGV